MQTFIQTFTGSIVSGMVVFWRVFRVHKTEYSN
jgi:hypothetical protein